MKRAFKMLVFVLLVTICIPFALCKGVSLAEGENRLNNAIALYIGSSVAYVNNSEGLIDKSNVEVKPILENGRTLVPVRFITESFGATVQWDENAKEVTINLDEKIIKMIIGNSKIIIGDTVSYLDIPAKIYNGRTYIPLRKFAESIGKKIFYDRGLIIISDIENIFDTENEKEKIDDIIRIVNNMPTVGSYENLKKLVQLNTINRYYELGTVTKTGTTSVPGSAVVDLNSGSTDYSTTNVQVQGVDEADVVKTDGEFIYQVNKQNVVVLKAYPSDDIKEVSKLSFDDKNFFPIELYVDSKYLIVIGSHTKNILISEDVSYSGSRDLTQAVIYDISDKYNIQKIREVELEGYYVSSRKIGTSLYIVTNKSIGYYIEENSSILHPVYRDTVDKEQYNEIDFSNIRYFPNTRESNYMIIGALNLEKPENKINIYTYLGAGQNIYASMQDLYVAVTKYDYTYMDSVNSSPQVSKIMIPSSNTNKATTVYKFSLANGQITYLNKGEVPGEVINQFAMDENKNYFRIATTTGYIWSSKEPSENNVYVLDETMNIAGKIEGIAPGEKIYSVRFMGDKGYLVTFRTVDPLFVIDLKDPFNPAILGKLKIPGYSDYLHPYDENHIIGFGKNTEEYSGNAYYQGIKIALFDVSDVNNPIQKFYETIGDRGTDSEILRNHKALLFSKDRNIIAFPITLMEIGDKTVTGDTASITQYGTFTFQGAYVYELDLTEGFKLKGRITHMTDADLKLIGDYIPYDYDKNVERILYINNDLYTLSKGIIKANDLYTLAEKNSVVIQ